MINIQINDEYRDFVLGLCNRLSYKKVRRGSVICHKGDLGAEMYIILKGRIGVFLEKTSTKIAEDMADLMTMYSRLKETMKTPCTRETILKNIEFPYKDAIGIVLNCFQPEVREAMVTLLTYFEVVRSWSSDMLYLLASDRPLQYMQGIVFAYWMVNVQRSGEIIGEQALFNRTVRNATLLSLTKAELLILDKKVFEEYLGGAAPKQEERVKFFLYCFPSISRRVINNFQCMFQRSSRNRGEVIARAGTEASHLFIVEDGDIALVEKEIPESNKKLEISKLSIVGPSY